MSSYTFVLLELFEYTILWVHEDLFSPLYHSSIITIFINFCAEGTGLEIQYISNFRPCWGMI